MRKYTLNLIKILNYFSRYHINTKCYDIVFWYKSYFLTKLLLGIKFYEMNLNKFYKPLFILFVKSNIFAVNYHEIN